MKTSKIYYILNLLLEINSIMPCLCQGKSYDKIEIERIIGNIKERGKKKKKLLLYSSIATAVSVTMMLGLELGIYYKKRKAKKMWLNPKKLEKINSFMDDMEENYPDIMNESVDNIKKIIKDNAKKKIYNFDYFESKELEKMSGFMSISKI